MATPERPQPPQPLYPIIRACDEFLGADDPRAPVEPTRPPRFWRGAELF